MTLRQLPIQPQRVLRDARVVLPTRSGPRAVGHAHFWERVLSRRQFLKATAGATVAIVGAGALAPGIAGAKRTLAAPTPIPGGIHLSDVIGPTTPDPLFHVFPPIPGVEPSTIFDLNAFVGIAEISGSGTGTDLTTGTSTSLPFDVDMRFMRGVYVGVDGKHYNGTFAFI